MNSPKNHIKNHLDNFLIVLSIIFISISIYSLIKTKKRNIILESEVNYYKLENTNIKDNLLLMERTYGFLVDTSDRCYNEAGEFIRWTSFSSKEPKLAVRLSPEMCSSCIDYVLGTLKNIEKDIKPENIIIFSSFENYIPIKIFKITNNLNFNIYNVRKPIINYPLEQIKIPPIFILLNNRVENIFILDEKFPKLNSEYLLQLKQKYFN